MVPAQALERALSLGALVATACLMSTVITLYAVGRLDVKQAVDDGSETWRSVVYYRGSQAQASSSTMRGLRSQVRETLIEREGLRQRGGLVTRERRRTVQLPASLSNDEASL
jgi:hypothetical protein